MDKVDSEFLKVRWEVLEFWQWRVGKEEEREGEEAKSLFDLDLCEKINEKI